MDLENFNAKVTAKKERFLACLNKARKRTKILFTKVENCKFVEFSLEFF